jgi:hypothetical protein
LFNFGLFQLKKTKINDLITLYDKKRFDEYLIKFLDRINNENQSNEFMIS